MLIHKGIQKKSSGSRVLKKVGSSRTSLKVRRGKDFRVPPLATLLEYVQLVAKDPGDGVDKGSKVPLNVPPNSHENFPDEGDLDLVSGNSEDDMEFSREDIETLSQ
ncbi:hypothetical protein V6N13_088517 [Hibiscus sabdariffa]|uniref:Uncharacterized protein n=1 Tax=Hibiscus sabdariffa TaxID=183260 RepID=A0ABR2G0I4_9ROSI